jgi:hypothetical protein
MFAGGRASFISIHLYRSTERMKFWYKQCQSLLAYILFRFKIPSAAHCIYSSPDEYIDFSVSLHQVADTRNNG